MVRNVTSGHTDVERWRLARATAILRVMHAAGEHDDVQHTLLSLTFAVGLVRHRAYQDRTLTDQGREGDLNMLAGFIAAIVPIYEYALDARKAPRALRKHELEGGMFRDGAKELRFIDGRPPVRHMAVNVADVECVLALLRASGGERITAKAD